MLPNMVDGLKHKAVNAAVNGKLEKTPRLNKFLGNMYEAHGDFKETKRMLMTK